MVKDKITFATDNIAFVMLVNIYQSSLLQIIVFLKRDFDWDAFAISMWMMSNGIVIFFITLLLSITLVSILMLALLKILRKGKLRKIVILTGSVIFTIIMLSPLYVQFRYWEVNHYNFEHLNLVRDMMIGLVVLLVPRYMSKMSG